MVLTLAPQNPIVASSRHIRTCNATRKKASTSLFHCRLALAFLRVLTLLGCAYSYVLRSRRNPFTNGSRFMAGFLFLALLTFPNFSTAL